MIHALSPTITILTPLFLIVSSDNDPESLSSFSVNLLDMSVAKSLQCGSLLLAHGQALHSCVDEDVCASRAIILGHMEAKEATGLSRAALESINSFAGADKDAEILLLAPGDDMFGSIGISDDLGKDANMFVHVDNLGVDEVKTSEEVARSVDVDCPVSHFEGFFVKGKDKTQVILLLVWSETSKKGYRNNLKVLLCRNVGIFSAMVRWCFVLTSCL